MIWKEGDVCEKLLGYILVIFVLTDAHFLMFYFIFDFFFGLVYTFDSTIAND